MANFEARGNQWFTCPEQSECFRLFIVAFVGHKHCLRTSTDIFQVSTVVVLEVGGPLQGARRGPPAQTSGDVMKTPIKIVRREDRKVTHDVAISSTTTKRQRTPEVIVKSWIIESRERRRADLNRLQIALRSKEIEAITCG